MAFDYEACHYSLIWHVTPFSAFLFTLTQFWFAFQFDGRGYTFTRLCQGYCESPAMYNQALCDSLSSLVLYVDE